MVLFSVVFTFPTNLGKMVRSASILALFSVCRTNLSMGVGPSVSTLSTMNWFPQVLCLVWQSIIVILIFLVSLFTEEFVLDDTMYEQEPGVFKWF